MSRFTSILGTERRKMLETIGASSVDDLIAAVPAAFRLGRPLDLPPAASELEVSRELERKASAAGGARLVCFAGAGAYDHFIPAAVDHILRRSEFYTAYTPYQAEVSQGTLQCIYEYQTMISRLCALDCANASMYDGASAAAEAALMAMRVRRADRILVAGSLNPAYLDVVRTYLSHGGFSLNEVPFGSDGLLDTVALESLLSSGEAAGLLVQQPNFFGLVEDVRRLAEIVHSKERLLVQVTDPVAAAVIAPPGEAGADIAVGEGQSLGIPLSFGGPYAGFMACRKEFVRNMPGRIIGRTSDRAGQTGYVLTLQTREQHIRREKATSNICTNQALMALASTVYMTLAGEEGLREVASRCFSNSHYLEERLLGISGVSRIFSTPFFREFVLEFPMPAEDLRDRLMGAGFLAGVPLPDLRPGAMLVTATEKRTKSEMDGLAEAVASACAEV
ncbi:aminomethyl-transferring glycine dehydrogenase subunit GcvPA [Candidatus Fermentibacteria bacterium]|nr:aminomethyl-transferring glycine dehydrogenase subunit GcvPA [Candidatus Fermentibacteria bacterium]